MVIDIRKKIMTGRKEEKRRAVVVKTLISIPSIISFFTLPFLKRDGNTRSAPKPITD